MTIRFTDLTAEQIRLLRLHDGPEEDSIGLEVEEMETADLRASQTLLIKGLIEFEYGWRGTLWFRLTPAGQRVRENGAG